VSALVAGDPGRVGSCDGVVPFLGGHYCPASDVREDLDSVLLIGVIRSRGA